jgi:hypothetical protein
MQQIKILIVSLFLFGISGCEGGGFGHHNKIKILPHHNPPNDNNLVQVKDHLRILKGIDRESMMTFCYDSTSINHWSLIFMA